MAAAADPSDDSGNSSDEEIHNFYEHIPKKYLRSYPNPYLDDHGIKIPFMGLVVAGTGAGKSNLVMNLIDKFHGLATFPGGIWILTKNRDEPLYNALTEAIPEIVIREVRSEKTRVGWTLTNLPDLDEEFKVSEASLIIFDDLVAEKEQALVKIEQFYIRARKKGCSCLFLSQSYFKTPVTIRLNLHYLFLLKLSTDRDLKMILNEYTIGVYRSVLLAMYQFATRERFNFLLVDIAAPLQRRYRHNFRRRFSIDV